MPYKNPEKRKEKSRDAARSRRGKEADVFTELSSLVPIQDDVIQSMDKASVMRLAISHLKLRTLMKATALEEQEQSDALLNREYMKALGGFIVLLDDGGDIMFISEHVSKVLGLNQLDLLGSSLYEFVHPCDHDELREILDERDAEEDCKDREHTFFLRHKCTLTSKGRNVNLKSASYKVIRYTGHHLSSGETECLVLIGESIPQPINMGVPIDSFSFLSQHTLDLRFTYCDERVEELLGYGAEELMGLPLHEFHHAWDGEAMDKAYKGLFSKGQMWTERYRLLAKGGGYVWAESQATVVNNSKTDKPQCIICVHYILSGVEQRHCIMSQVQIKPERSTPVAPETCRKAAMSRPSRKAKGMCSSRDSTPIRNKAMYTATQRTKDLDNMQHEFNQCQITKAQGESFYDPVEVDVVNMLEDVLFNQENVGGLDLRTGSMQPNQPANMVQVPPPINKMGGTQNLPFATSLASLMAADDDVNTDNEASPAYVGAMPLPLPPAVPSACAHALVDSHGRNGVDGIPNLEALADNPKRSLSVDKKLLEQQTAAFFENDDIDMDMRAPYIPMSGDEDLIFSMVPPIPLIDEMDCVSNMLGTTESVFAPLPEDPEEKNKMGPVPISILRQEAMQKQERQLMGMGLSNARSVPQANTPDETTRLETGPPAKRARVLLAPRMDACDDDLFPSPPTCSVPPEDITTGSMVLKNLLVKGEDANTGYDINDWNKRTETVASAALPASPSWTLRGLLTGPLEDLSPPTSPTKRVITMDPAAACVSVMPMIQVLPSPSTPLQHQVPQSSIEVSSTTNVDTAPSPACSTTSGKNMVIVPSPTPSVPDVAANASVATTSVGAGTGTDGKKPLIAKRITIKTVGGPTTEANQIVLTDEIIRLLIKFGQAQVTVYNQ